MDNYLVARVNRETTIWCVDGTIYAAGVLDFPRHCYVVEFTPVTSGGTIIVKTEIRAFSPEGKFQGYLREQ